MTFSLDGTHDAQHDEREALYKALNEFFLPMTTVYMKRYVGRPIRPIIEDTNVPFTLDDSQASVSLVGSPHPTKFANHISRMMTGFLKDELQIVHCSHYAAIIAKPSTEIV